jgi:hypothetical protein
VIDVVILGRNKQEEGGGIRRRYKKSGMAREEKKAEWWGGGVEGSAGCLRPQRSTKVRRYRRVWPDWVWGSWTGKQNGSNFIS